VPRKRVTFRSLGVDAETAEVLQAANGRRPPQVNPRHTLGIIVDPGQVFTDVTRWCEYYHKEIGDAIVTAVKQLGFEGKLHVRIAY